jgi:hypothetical protein
LLALWEENVMRYRSSVLFVLALGVASACGARPSEDAPQAIQTAAVEQSDVAEEPKALMSLTPEEDALVDEPAEAEVTANACIGLGGSCAGNPKGCCAALSCFGPDHHETCQCSSARTFTASYDSKRLSGVPGCSEDSNPFGVAHTITKLRGCGEALRPDVCGNGIIVPVFVTKKGADVACGPVICR